MDDIYLTPHYKVGDLVSCVYLYYNHHYYYSRGYCDEPEPDDFYNGIIIDIDYACWDGFEDDAELIYVVHCTDGVRRFFSEHEVRKLS